MALTPKTRGLVMGQLYQKNKDYERAEASFIEHLNVNPEDSSALKQLAQVYEQTKKFDKAFEIYERCYLAQPENRTGVLLDICRILLRNEIWLENVDYGKWLNLAIKNFPNNPIVVDFKAFLSTLPPDVKHSPPRPVCDDPLSKILDKLNSLELKFEKLEQTVSKVCHQAPATSASATPAPITPAPATTTPAASAPAIPAPAATAPAVLAPAIPAPATPAPATPAPATPAPAAPASAKAVTAKTAPVTSVPAPITVLTPARIVAPVEAPVVTPVSTSIFAPVVAPVAFPAVTPIAATLAAPKTGQMETSKVASVPASVPFSIPISAPFTAPVSASKVAPVTFSSTFSSPFGTSFSSPFSTSFGAPVKTSAPPSAPEAAASLFQSSNTTSPFSFGNIFEASLKKYNLPTDGLARQEEERKEEREEKNESDIVPNEELPIENFCDMKPIEIKTGEEEEDIVFENRCKLYRLKDKEYKERGLGAIKVLEHKTTGKGRLIMRREAIGLVCLNCWNCTKIERVRDNQVRWVGLDASDGEPEATVFLIKFKTQDLTDTFLSFLKNLFPEDGDVSSTTSTKTPTTVTTTASSSEKPEIEIVDPKVNPALVEKARQHQLPDLFYHQLKNQGPCSGCNGCEDED